MHNAYGAKDMLMDYANLPSNYLTLKSEIVWSHGWIPSLENFDPDLIVAESGQVSEQANFTYLVARQDQQEALEGFGLDSVFAVGLPYAYALSHYPHAINRRGRSLLIMPAWHGVGTPDVEISARDEEYISSLKPYLGEFEETLVTFNCDDFASGRREAWERAGFSVSIGGCSDDPTSLKRLVDLFTGFEFMTTNGFGSHIAYAAASGCKVSVFGPKPGINPADLAGLEFFRNRPDLLPRFFEMSEDQYLRELFSDTSILCEPHKAINNTEWGAAQIGMDQILPPERIAALLTQKRVLTSRVSILREALVRRRNKVREVFRLSFCVTSESPVERFIHGLKNTAQFLKPADVIKLSRGPGSRPIALRRGTSDLMNFSQHFWEGELDGVDFGSPRRILDLGAYAGYSVRYLRERFPDAEIVAVEADPKNFEVLKMNCGDMEGVHLINAAVMGTSGKVSIIQGGEGLWSNKTVEGLPGKPDVQALTLGDILKGVGWNGADAIKMDIEGSEYEVLLPLARKISKLCQIIAIEFHHTVARKKDYEQTIQGLSASAPGRQYQLGEYTVFDFRSNQIEPRG